MFLLKKHYYLLCIFFLFAGCADIVKTNQGEFDKISSYEIDATDSKIKNSNEKINQFTFSWPFVDSANMKPRGGNTVGQKVTLDKEPNERYIALRENNLTKLEKDRRAILAMTGAFRVSFDFIETEGYTENYKPTQPYQSWGTEYVYIVEDKPEFISLQHILVMFFSTNENSISPEPMVVKHWRQDWKFQDERINVFSGFKTWKSKVFSKSNVEGKWSQSVFQVDDSPRYQAHGVWSHKGNLSTWLSNETWRPLPRREFSVRNDYNVLIGTNRHTITPSGWVQGEENFKVILSKPSILKKYNPIVAKEIGVARYERITDHDWSAGNDYWKKTAPFWQEVRKTWSRLLEQNQVIQLKLKPDGPPLFMKMFELAEKSVEENNLISLNSAYIEKIINSYIVSP
tara:strand:+ start:708 stop:1907 length:1200 start_codon:yes stop_codon:yes gene_type:complete